MARPTPFDRQSSFALFSAENPGEPHSGVDIDAEFNAVLLALDETQANLALIQDEDGRLARGSVGRLQLDASINLGFEAPSAWAADTSYEADISTTFHQSKFYIAVVTHISSEVFDASKWQEIADFTLQNTLNDGDVGTTKIADLAVTTAKLAALGVTTAKIAAEAVTADKIGDAAVIAGKIADDAVLTANIVDQNITLSKLYASAAPRVYGRYTPDGGAAELLSLEPGVFISSGGVLSVALPRGFIDGFVLSNGTDATNDINFAAGVSSSSAAISNMVLVAAMGKQLDVAWAAGGTTTSPKGGRDTGAIANGTWHCFVVGKLGVAITNRSRASNVATLSKTAHGFAVGQTVRLSGVGGIGYDGAYAIASVPTADTFTVACSGGNEGSVACGGTADVFDAIFSTSTTPTLPSGYTVYQMVGSILRESAAIVPFTQNQDVFLRKVPIRSVSLADPGVAAVLHTLDVPKGIQVEAIVDVHSRRDAGGNEAYMIVSSPDETDTEPVSTLHDLSSVNDATRFIASSRRIVKTDTSGRIRTRQSASNGNTFVQINTRGWVHPRGKNV